MLLSFVDVFVLLKSYVVGVVVHVVRLIMCFY
jgi:hypothetical protein